MLNDADERPIGYRPIMSERQILDFRAGNPWTERAATTFRTVSQTAWADPTHPSSEGRRSATWREAIHATVAQCTGFGHVRFAPNRRSAYAQLAASGITPQAVPLTHRRHVLRLAQHHLAVDADGAWRGALPDGTWIGFQVANDETGVRDALPTGRRILLDSDVALGRIALPSAADVIVADARAWGSPVDCALVLARQPLDFLESVQVSTMAVATEALTDALQHMPERSVDESNAMDALEQRLQAEIPDVQFHGTNRVGHIRSFSVLHLDGETLMRALDEAGYVVGSGSACAQDGSPSDVLAAMGRITHGNVRLALPVHCDLTKLSAFADTLIATVARLRREAGVDDL